MGRSTRQRRDDRSRRALAVGALLALALATPALAGSSTTWYVDDNGPGEPPFGDANPSISDPNEDGSFGYYSIGFARTDREGMAHGPWNESRGSETGTEK